MEKSKKKFLLFLVISIIVVCVVIFYLVMIFVLYKPVCDYSSPGEGWHCIYSVKQEIPERLENKYKDKCDLDGGEFDSGKFLPGSGIVFTCHIPFSDYKEPCQNSDECKGTCIYIGKIPDFCTEIEGNVYSCSETVEGICSQEKKGSCTPHYEVDGNKIYNYMGLCDY